MSLTLITQKTVKEHFVNSKFVLIEFSADIMGLRYMYESIEVRNSCYSLKGLVRCFQNHFTCAVYIRNKWVYFDDLCHTVKEYSSLKQLSQCYNAGWYFAIYQLVSTKVEVGKSAVIPSEVSNSNIRVTTKQQYSKKHFMNSRFDSPGTYSCAVDCFLELSAYVFLPFIKQLPHRSNFLDLLFQTVTSYVQFQGPNKKLSGIREPFWLHLIKYCNSFSARDNNACFSQIFEERTFGKLNKEEVDLLMPQLVYGSICRTCQRHLMFCRNHFVTFVNHSSVINAGYDLSSWPLYVSNILNLPVINVTCSDCGNMTCEAVVESFINSRFVFIEFSLDIVKDAGLPQEIELQKASYSLKGLVRCYQKHFTCAVCIEEKWIYFDDMCNSVREFSSLKQLQQQYPLGWFFIILQLNNDTSDVNCIYLQNSSNQSCLNETQACASECVNSKPNPAQKIAKTECKTSNVNSADKRTYSVFQPCNQKIGDFNKIKPQREKKRQKTKQTTKGLSQPPSKKDTVEVCETDEKTSVKQYNFDQRSLDNWGCRDVNMITEDVTVEYDQKVALDIVEKDLNIDNGKSKARSKVTVTSQQTTARNNMKKFHKAIQFTIYQCHVCREAWPLRTKPKNENKYICCRCLRDKSNPKKFSLENLMIPSSVPKELQGLTQFEEMLIA